jgi:hypothetical protein
MIHKYTVEYTMPSRKQARPNQYLTDDPVACEQFVERLLEQGFPICAIKREGIGLPKIEFDHIVRTAAAMMASKRNGTSPAFATYHHGGINE